MLKSASDRKECCNIRNCNFALLLYLQVLPLRLTGLEFILSDDERKFSAQAVSSSLFMLRDPRSATCRSAASIAGPAGGVAAEMASR